MQSRSSHSGRRRSPSWGAWIEMPRTPSPTTTRTVAPPRGERGLKFLKNFLRYNPIEVAPPRGERGLKFTVGVHSCGQIESLPLVGSVD